MRNKFYVDLPLGMMLLGGSFVLGGLLGFLFGGLIPQEEDLSLCQYFLDYFQAVQAGEGKPSLISLWISNLKAPFFVFCLGFSFLGVLGLPLLFFFESFVFTFSVSTLCRVLGVSGILPAFVLFGLPALWWTPLLFLLGQQSFQSAWNLRRGQQPQFPPGYWLPVLLSFLGLMLRVAYEYWILPSLLCGVL